MTGRFPFGPYPRGWYQVGYSDELPEGGVRPLKALGRDLALFRSGGKAAVLDAHCPHLGAHLGVGGSVEDGALRCPFHGWRFKTDGSCLDSKARTRSHDVRELSGLILMAQGEPGFEPPSIDLNGWAPYEKRHWKVRTHVQEPLENVVDPAHFHALHGHGHAPKTEVKTAGHILRARSSMKMGAPGGKELDGVMEWESHGPGFGLMRVSGAAKVLFAVCGTPIDGEHIDLRFSFASSKDNAPGLGEGVIREITRQIEQDIPIWENKVWLPYPLLAPEESGIKVMRDWAKQFQL